MQNVLWNYLVEFIAAFQWLDTPPGTERIQVRVLSAIQLVRWCNG